MTPGRDVGLAARDLLERAADVQGWRSVADVRLPGHGPVQRPVHLEDPSPVFEATHGFDVALRQARSSEIQQVARRDVQQRAASARKLLQVCDPVAAVHLTAKALKLGDHRIDDAHAAAFHDRPSDRMRKHAKQQRKRAGARRPKR